MIADENGKIDALRAPNASGMALKQLQGLLSGGLLSAMLLLVNWLSFCTNAQLFALAVGCLAVPDCC